MASAAVKISVEEFLALPETEGLHRELVHGEIWEEPAENRGETYDVVKSNLAQALYLAVSHSRHFRVTFSASFRLGDAVLVPDLGVLIKSDAESLACVPDIAVEIVSSDSASRLMQKIAVYREVGVSETWVLYPRLSTLAIYTKNAVRELRRADTLTSPLLPGFALPLSELFS